MTFATGATIVHQEVWRGRVWAARPLTVVEDTPDRLLLWIPQGTVRKVPMTPPSRVDPARRDARAIVNLAHADWAWGDHVWDVSSLWILRPGDWHGVWVSWRPAGHHFGWYVNLQMPFRRTALGIESMDLALDITVSPDLSWRWKDEEEFDEIHRRSIFDAATVARVREEAATLVDRIERVAAPFSEPWPQWRPDSQWSLPGPASRVGRGPPVAVGPQASAEPLGPLRVRR